jgi:hypothetical protein
MPPTDSSIRITTPGAKPIRPFHAGGLCLEISPNGAEWRRFDYRRAGANKRVSRGVYPDVPLASGEDEATSQSI